MVADVNPELSPIEIRGIPHYIQWICGAGATQPRGDRPVMVFVHGWGGSGRYWEETARRLSDRFDCLLYDLRGFGRTPETSTHARDPRFTMEAYGTDLGDLLEHLDLHRVTLNAHSMGASIATLYAADPRAAQRVERLILTCSGLYTYNPVTFGLFHRIGSWVVSIRPQWLSRLPGMERMFMARFVHRPLPTPLSRAFLEDYLQADQTTVTGTLYTAVSLQAAQTMPPALQALPMPTLLIAGQKDQIIPPRLGRKAIEVNPQIQYAEIPRVGHFPMLEAPDAYLQVLEEFLSSTQIVPT